METRKDLTIKNPAEPAAKKARIENSTTAASYQVIHKNDELDTVNDFVRELRQERNFENKLSLQIKSLQQELDMLKKLSQKSEQQFQQQFEQQLEQFNNQLSDLQERSALNEAKLKKDLSDLQTELDYSLKEIKAREADIKPLLPLKNLPDTIKEQKQLIENQKKAMQTEDSLHKEKIDAYEKLITELRNELQAAKDTLIAEQKKWEGRYETSKKEHQKSMYENSFNFINRIKALKQNIKSLEAQISELTGQAARYEEALTKSNSQICEKSKELQALQTSMHPIAAENKLLLQSAREFEKRIQCLQNEKRELETTNQQQSASHSSLVCELQKNNSALLARLNEQDQKIKEQADTINAQNQRIKEQADTINVQNQKINEQAKKINVQNQKINSFARTNSKLQGLLEKQDKVNEKINDQLDTQEDEIDRLSGKNAELKTTIVQLQKLKIQNENFIHSEYPLWQKNIQLLKEDIRLRDKQICVLNKEKTELNNSIAGMSAAFTDQCLLNEEISPENLKLTQDNTKELDDVRTKLKNREDGIRVILEGNLQTIRLNSDLSDQLKQAKMKLSQANGRWEVAKKENELLNELLTYYKQCAEPQQTNQDLAKQQTVLFEKFADIKAEIQKLDLQYKTLNQKLTEQTKEIEQLTEQNAIITKSTEQNAKAKDQDISDLQQCVLDLRKQLTTHANTQITHHSPRPNVLHTTHTNNVSQRPDNVRPQGMTLASSVNLMPSTSIPVLRTHSSPGFFQPAGTPSTTQSQNLQVMTKQP